MELMQTFQVQADPARTWRALTAVTTYPRWTASMTEVAALDGPQVVTGHRFRIRQPGLPAAVWQVTDVHDGAAFNWESRAIGLRTVAFHRMTDNGDGTTELTIGLRQTGPLAGLVGLLFRARIRRSLALEAAGLRAAAEE
jgi:hypothetical protein